MRSEEVVVPFDVPPADVRMATAVRSTVLLSSLRGLRQRGLYPAYVAKLASRSIDPIMSMSVGHWIPIAVALDHYAACDALDLARSVMVDIGRESGLFLNQTVLGVVLRLSKEAGVTPWPAIGQSRRLIARTWEGTSIAAFKLGPKEARFEWLGQPCATSGYFRVAFGGFLQGLLSLFSRRAFVHESARHVSASSVGYECSWV